MFNQNIAPIVYNGHRVYTTMGKLFIIDAKDNVIAKVGVNDNKDFDFDSMYKLAAHQIKLRTKEYAR